MEILAIILSGIISLGSGGGVILEQLAQGKVRSQILSIDQQAIRIDNRPNYQIARGKVQQIRLANRGIRLKPGLRIASLDLAIDPLNLDLRNINSKNLNTLKASLPSPVSGALQLTLSEADLNQALRSPDILNQLQTTLNQLIISKAGSTNIKYQVSDPKVDLLPHNRLQVSLTLSRARSLSLQSLPYSDASDSSRKLSIMLSLGLEISQGKKLRLLDPQGTVNGQQMSSRLLQGFARGISNRLDLGALSNDGIFSRILQLKISEDQLKLSCFARLDPKKP